MTDLTKPFFGNPRETAKADKARALRAVPYETTWLDEFLRGMFGAETPGGSVFDPDREAKVKANSVGQGLGIATDLAGPAKAAALGALPALGGIIGGPLAKSAFNTPKAVARAEDLAKAGKSPGYILQETNLVPTPLPGGQRAWGPQIYDGNAQINPETLQNLVPAFAQSKNPITRLPDLLEHPDLYEKYPHLKDVQVNRVNGFDQLAGTLGSMSSKQNRLQLTQVNSLMPERTVPAQLKERTGIALHEIQHAVQDLEGWPRGGSPREFAKSSTDRAEKVQTEYQKRIRDALIAFQGEKLAATPNFLIKKAVDLDAGNLDPTHLPGPLRQQVEKLAADRDLLDNLFYLHTKQEQTGLKIRQRKQEAFNTYESLAGEAQARAVQRAYMEDVSPFTPQSSLYDLPQDKLLFLPPFSMTLKK